MPVGERSEPTIIYEMLLELAETVYRFLAEEWRVPFRQEEVSRDEYLRRLLAMPRDQAAAELMRLAAQQQQ